MIFFLFAGLQSLWVTALCSSQLQHRHKQSQAIDAHVQPMTQNKPPPTSVSSDKLLQTPTSETGKLWVCFRLKFSLFSLFLFDFVSLIALKLHRLHVSLSIKYLLSLRQNWRHHHQQTANFWAQKNWLGAQLRNH